MNIAQELQRISGKESLVIAGGVGLNGLANHKIEKTGTFKNVWVQPAAGDDGGALGAALYISKNYFQTSTPYYPTPFTPFLGPSYSDQEIGLFLESEKYDLLPLDQNSLLEKVATLLSQGLVGGWFQGHMEFGPRALGSRSILADARNANMKDILNKKIKLRESFRPFAPAILSEKINEYFDIIPTQDFSYMTKVVSVHKEKREIIPAATHEDGTARVQSVSKQLNPLFHKLISKFDSITGVPLIINTSLNLKGEPIACSPRDAYKTFKNSEMDFLALGSYLILKKPLQTKKTSIASKTQSLEHKVKTFYFETPLTCTP